MIATLMLFLAYLLPLPIAGACFYYHIFGGVQAVGMRLLYICILSIAPSVMLLIFALDRILHSIFHILTYAVIFYLIYHSGLVGHIHAVTHVK